jgi:ferredoxin
MRKIVTHSSLVDWQKCIGCKTCINVCPVTAIKLVETKKEPKAVVDRNECQACTICITRCPEYAIELELRASPLIIGMDVTEVSSEEIATICRSAHMYPNQIVCYCHRIQAQEVVAAILSGAQTPEQVSRMTGARTGCGVLCITSVIRLLRAAGLELTRAPGYQWNGNITSIWDLPDEILRKYDRNYYLLKDRESLNEILPGSEHK